MCMDEACVALDEEDTDENLAQVYDEMIRLIDKFSTLSAKPKKKREFWSCG